MSEETKKPKTWKEVIIQFFEYKVAKSTLYKAREYIEAKERDMANEKEEKKLKRLLEAKNKKQLELEQSRRDAPSTEIRQWIEATVNTNISEGKRILKASHVLKFSHGSSASEGLVADENSNDSLLTTSSFKKELTYDLAHNNGALITISRFLALKLSGKLIIDLILDDDFVFMKPFCKDQAQLASWEVGFKGLVEQREIATAEKTKQIYFPVTSSDSQSVANEMNRFNYHLIVPLFPSSIAEEVYTTITDLKYSKEQKEVRACKKSGDSGRSSPRFHQKPYIDYPNVGIQSFGGAQPQNISMLNKNRSGQSFLFSAQPPIWKTRLKPPIYRKSLFDDFYNSDINTEIDYLRDFLVRFKQLDLSIKDPKRMKHLERWVSNLIDEFLFYVATLQNMPSGWSDQEGIRLKREHQYLLDPYRMDDAFQSARQSGDWQAVIRADFAQWLNRKLRGKDKQFTPQKEHTRLWKKLLETPLREFVEPIEDELKLQAGELV